MRGSRRCATLDEGQCRDPFLSPHLPSSIAGCFPEAERDPIIQIANVVTVQGSATAAIRNVLVLGETSAIVGANVICFEKEEDLVSRVLGDPLLREGRGPRE